jgi:LacI family transcriptional regulator
MDDGGGKTAPAQRGKVTIRTVAEHAGVSVAAVSKVLRNAYGVSDALRQNVMESIETLGYRPSAAARGMRGRTFTVGILLVEIGNPFLPEVVEGINDILAPSEFKSLMGMGRSYMPVETGLIEQMIDFHMDGLILVAPRMSGKVLDRYARQIPIVVIGHHEATAAHFDTVNSDDQQGGFMATEALLAAGHRDVVMLTQAYAPDSTHAVAGQRERGYREAMERAGLAPRVVALPYDGASVPDHLRRFLFEPGRPSAVFCWSDLFAVDLVNIARAEGLRVPEDLAIVGYDNSPLAALPLVKLSSIDQSGRRLGALAAESLLSRMEGRSAPHHILLEPKLVRRSSI